MNRRNLYPLNGADRFQLYFDDIARRNTGTGNVIRSAIKIEGVIPEPVIRRLLEENVWLRFLSTLSLRRNFFSSLYRFESKSDLPLSLTVHHGSYEQAMLQALSKDCNLNGGVPVHADVMYVERETHLVISASHVLMDHAGMENLISSFAGENNLVEIAAPVKKKSFVTRLADATAATAFVSSLSGRSMKRLAGKRGNGKASFRLIECTTEETDRVKNLMTKEMNASELSFYLGSSLFAISKFPSLLTGKNYFVPVPMDRRPASAKTSLLSNFISFIYFRATDADVESMKKSVEGVSRQTISQARKKIPGKFSSLLDLFRYVPGKVYKAFIELPGHGHAATFAFSLLPNSGLAGKKILNHKVEDVTHYAPVISPPGLNVIFSEYNDRLKILCSFDESRMTSEDVLSYLGTLKLILLG